jgi:hypothetical protein
MLTTRCDIPEEVNVQNYTHFYSASQSVLSSSAAIHSTYFFLETSNIWVILSRETVERVYLIILLEEATVDKMLSASAFCFVFAECFRDT